MKRSLHLTIGYLLREESQIHFVRMFGNQAMSLEVGIGS